MVKSPKGWKPEYGDMEARDLMVALADEIKPDNLSADEAKKVIDHFFLVRDMHDTEIESCIELFNKAKAFATRLKEEGYIVPSEHVKVRNRTNSINRTLRGLLKGGY